jgi:hypothetical protein
MLYVNPAAVLVTWIVPVATAHVGSVTVVIGNAGAPGATATSTLTEVIQPAAF